MSRARVAVIGGGIFGVSAAVELGARHEVLLFERHSELLMGATYANHNRHHYGFHYPRSLETARQCLDARASFEETYGSALVADFANYYCVAREGSRTTPDGYLRFCESIGAAYEEAWPPAGVLDRERIAIAVRVGEPVYDHDALRRVALRRLGETPGVTVLLGHEVKSGSLSPGGLKTLEVVTRGTTSIHEVDVVINATYARYNEVCRWFGFPAREFQYNLQELDVIRLPGVDRIGVTIQDGSFPSFLPFARTGEYLLAHVEASQLVREVSDSSTGLLQRVPHVASNWENVLRVSAEHIPILREAVYVRSLFGDRVVEARTADDARITEIAEHGSGCWSVFGAKVITAVATARTLRALVDKAL